MQLPSFTRARTSLLKRLAFTLPACAVVFCVSPMLVYGDEIDLVTVSNLTFQAAAGNNSCGGFTPQPCKETFNASFQWDNTTESLVPGTESVTATGALSASDVAGPWTIADFVAYSGGLGFPIEEFPGPDYIAIFDTDWVTPISPGVYPYSDAGMACFEAPSQCNSLFDFTDSSGVHSPFAISGTITIATVSTPEPSSLLLSCIGILSVAGALRRRRLRG